MSQPVYFSAPVSYPMTTYPSGPMANPSLTWPSQGTPGIPSATSPRLAWTPQPTAPQSTAPQPTTPRPIFRAKGPDEPSASPVSVPARIPTPLSMPTPEQLGVARAPVSVTEELDCTAQLEKLGAVCFRMDQLKTGGCRFTCLLPTRQTGITHRVEVEAPTATEAARMVLEQAQEWTRHPN